MRTEQYIISIDQSTQGTKALLFNEKGQLLYRTDKNHRQIVNEIGWVSHDPEEIYQNTIWAVKTLLEENQVDKTKIKCVGISNQRETAMAWDRESGCPLDHAIVWQCARGNDICKGLEARDLAADIQKRTGLRLSPYFSAAKLAWILQQDQEKAKALAAADSLCCGTMDSWLVYQLTGRKVFATDYSNASRTQLFNLMTLEWDEQLCRYFNIPITSLPQVKASDDFFGMTDFAGILPMSIPIHGVLGDSHGALFGQGCIRPGMLKTTYGTGSSIMMNIGSEPILSEQGLVTSLAWKAGGKVEYVLEGNINYTGAVVTWMKNNLGLIQQADETEALAAAANPADTTYLVPAFSGLGAPYWRSDVSAAYIGMSRMTGRAELVRAGLASIVYQITDVIDLMKQETGIDNVEVRVDGGPTGNQ